MTTTWMQECEITHPRSTARLRNQIATITFLLGAAAGNYAAPPSCALTRSPTVSSTILGVGEHLCRPHEGIANITRLDEDHYAFACRELAEFPRVPITVAREMP